MNTSCNLINIPTTDDSKFNGEVLDIRLCKSNAACIRSDSCCERWGEGEGDLGLISWEVKVWGVGDGGRGEGAGVLDRAVSADIREGGEGSERHKTETEIKRLQNKFLGKMSNNILNSLYSVAPLLQRTSTTDSLVSKNIRNLVSFFHCYIYCSDDVSTLDETETAMGTRNKWVTLHTYCLPLFLPRSLSLSRFSVIKSKIRMHI